MARSNRPLESATMAAVKSAVAILGLDLWRQNTGAARLPGKGGSMRLVRFGRKGDTDWTGILPGGRRIDLECKRPGETPTPEQLERMRRTNAAGGVGVWIDDPAKVYGILKSISDGASIEVGPDGRQWVAWPDAKGVG